MIKAEIELIEFSDDIITTSGIVPISDNTPVSGDNSSANSDGWSGIDWNQPLQ